MSDFTSAAVGDPIAEREIELDREALVRYAGASGDFNPIHYRDDVAERVGLPGVLAHGMLTMGLAIQPVVEALGDPGRIRSYSARFTRPVVVDPEAGARLHVLATIGRAADKQGLGRIELLVRSGEQTVLGKARIVADLRGAAEA
ncbi:MAG: MaoC/PaaZ C-terminal domain-containing protein [Pseudoclavibacter sp.]|nr:MaoC/PaaZ C-terminal domain-containing protein [Pseudoclavibacter sp.]